MVIDLYSLLFIVYGENKNEDDVRISNQELQNMDGKPLKYSSNYIFIVQ